jgi:16S rRNA G1207 methylase RsmC
LELIETTLLGGVREVVGTDLSEKAIGIARDNWAAAGIDGVKATFLAGDFRGYAEVPTLASGKLSLIISNPPLGRRVRVPNLHGLFADLFRAAAETLRPGGRLIFVNPLRLEPTDKSLRREYRQVVDLGGYDCRVEMYVKS